AVVVVLLGDVVEAVTLDDGVDFFCHGCNWKVRPKVDARTSDDVVIQGGCGRDLTDDKHIVPGAAGDLAGPWVYSGCGGLLLVIEVVDALGFIAHGVLFEFTGQG